MILWILLFVGVVILSFLLALQSMRDYQEIPPRSRYGLFLIRNPRALTAGVLNHLAQDFLETNQLISFERLFKGNKSTLLIFGPRELFNLYDMLELLELEDYTDVNWERISAWEVGVKEGKGESLDFARDKSEKGKGIFENLSGLQEEEHFWWQLVLSGSFKPERCFFEIRAVLLSDDIQRKKLLTEELQNLAPGNLFTLPKAFSNQQLLDFYQKRSLKRDNKNPSLKPEEVLNLISIN